MRVALARFARTLVGDRPRLLLGLVVPTGLALLVDLVLRGGQLAGYALQGKAIYASSLLVSAAFWALPLWAVAHLRDGRSTRARIASASLVGLWLFPFATLGFAGQLLLDGAARAGLASYAGRRTYMQDVHETVVDLLGLEDARRTLPLAAQVQGRSLLRPRTSEPAVLLATSTAVWEPDDARFGVMQGERKLVGGPTGAWSCFDLSGDPHEQTAGPAGACGDLLTIARGAFAGVADPH